MKNNLINKTWRKIVFVAVGVVASSAFNALSRVLR